MFVIHMVILLFKYFCSYVLVIMCAHALMKECVMSLKAKLAMVLLYRGENKLQFYDMIMSSAL